MSECCKVSKENQKVAKLKNRKLRADASSDKFTVCSLASQTLEKSMSVQRSCRNYRTES